MAVTNATWQSSTTQIRPALRGFPAACRVIRLAGGAHGYNGHVLSIGQHISRLVENLPWLPNSEETADIIIQPPDGGTWVQKGGSAGSASRTWRQLPFYANPPPGDLTAAMVGADVMLGVADEEVIFDFDLMVGRGRLAGREFGEGRQASSSVVASETSPLVLASPLATLSSASKFFRIACSLVSKFLA